jgi:serine/threonine protein kinase
MQDSPRATRGIELPDRYELLHHIADGGMASVWCGRDRVLGRMVAIKLLSRSYASDEAAVRRFEREARAAARVSGHRQVVTVFDVGMTLPDPDSLTTVQAPFIAMEYMEGGSVHQALAAGPVEPALSLRWLAEMASALDYAHERGVVHRDIKPGNLLLDGAGSVHVADFGIARIAAETSITRVGEVLGTAAYLPPEQALGRAATADGDRYSLAVVAYELLAGTRPFDGKHLETLRANGAALRPPPASLRNPSLPPAVDAILARGLARVPSRRWPTASEFVRRLEHALAGAAVAPSLPETLPPETLRKPHYARFRARRIPPRPLRSVLGTIAALALVAGLAAGADGGAGRKKSAHRDGAQVQRKATHARTAARRTKHSATPKPAAAAIPGSVQPTPAGPPGQGGVMPPGHAPGGPPGHRHGGPHGDGGD